MEREIETKIRPFWEDDSDLPDLDGTISFLQDKILEIREFVIKKGFETSADEVFFFKLEKPELQSKLIYFTEVKRINGNRPVGSLELRTAFLKAELARIDHYFINKQEFFHYYTSGATLLDEFYFVRRGMAALHADADLFDYDPLFSTGYDTLLAHLLANDKIAGFLDRAIKQLEIRPDSKSREVGNEPGGNIREHGFAQTPFRGSEIYVLLKALIDSQAIVNHSYKSFFELVVPGIANSQHKRFQPGSLLKYSDKVDSETRENAKRLLQRMIRNIDTY